MTTRTLTGPKWKRGWAWDDDTATHEHATGYEDVPLASSVAHVAVGSVVAVATFGAVVHRRCVEHDACRSDASLILR